jgi:hypothetical protein
MGKQWALVDVLDPNTGIAVNGSPLFFDLAAISILPGCGATARALTCEDYNRLARHSNSNYTSLVGAYPSPSAIHYTYTEVDALDNYALACLKVFLDDPPDPADRDVDERVIGTNNDVIRLHLALYCSRDQTACIPAQDPSNPCATLIASFLFITGEVSSFGDTQQCQSTYDLREGLSPIAGYSRVLSEVPSWFDTLGQVYEDDSSRMLNAQSKIDGASNIGVGAFVLYEDTDTDPGERCAGQYPHVALVVGWGPPVGKGDWTNGATSELALAHNSGDVPYVVDRGVWEGYSSPGASPLRGPRAYNSHDPNYRSGDGCQVDVNLTNQYEFWNN